ncbi:unnamed protein product [Miscanthus lutarioriparius]|uniref:Alpha/beta hydrolase fold-3 domain-containing protein n=1 Tax=Miscanthus lutarioriparius TaxID=422564 RepID=A0A811PFQ5_9POAL|nr:unnamed protein product [Miscanthus lutarioriparius]
MASSKPSFPFPVLAPDPSDEVVREFGPLLRIYKSGRIERPLVAPPVDPSHDAATGVQSKDVHLGSYSAKLPVVVYVHGDGFVAESAASPSYHLFLNRLAAAVPALVVSVDYRLAPEHPLPAGYEDCLATLKWALSAADPWVAAHGDLARVFVAGDSAGGNICHHLTIHPDIVVGVQQESRPPPPPLKGAVLIHPTVVADVGRRAHPRGRGRGARGPHRALHGRGALVPRVPQDQRYGRPADEPHGARSAEAPHAGVRPRHGVRRGGRLPQVARPRVRRGGGRGGLGDGDAGAGAGVELLETMADADDAMADMDACALVRLRACGVRELRGESVYTLVTVRWEWAARFPEP